MASKGFARANNTLVDAYNKEKRTSYILYLDANNLRGWAMSEVLPKGDKGGEGL